MNIKLPNNFIWGASIGGAQCEGAWNEDGRGESVTDHMSSSDKKKNRHFSHNFDPDYYYPNRDGNNFYHNYEEDIKYLSEMGFKSLRFSISWTRIYPSGEDDKPNKKGLEFYRNVLMTLKKYNIEPIIMLSHLDFPYNLAMKYNGWSNRKTIDLFLKFARTIIEEYKGLVKYYFGFNEVNILCQSIGKEIGGIIPKNDFDINLVASNPKETKEEINLRFKALHHQFIASAKLTLLAKKIDSEIKIGVCVSGKCIYPMTCNPKDVLAAQQAMQIPDWFVADVTIKGSYPYFAKRYFEKNGVDYGYVEGDNEILKAGTVDFYGTNYYSTGCISADDSTAKDCQMNMFISSKNPYLKATEWGWQIDPDGLRYLCNEIYGRYGIPIMILENGIGANEILNENMTVSDSYRVDYIRRHIEVMKEIIDDGIDLIGYFYWAPIDLVSASTGEMSKRYGFVYVDKDDLGNGTYKRYKKESFEWMKKAIMTNGNELE